MQFGELIDSAPENLAIVDALAKCKMQVKRHQKIMASVSGGSDSDVMLDLIVRCGGKDKTTFVFFNTGLEYEATKKQLEYLNDKYGIDIQVIPPVKPIPTCVRQYGVPFWSKQVSDMIERLQRHNFQWEDEPLDVLLEKYPKCKSALRWWCNDWSRTDKYCPFDIGYVRWLKEFLIAHPPAFPISNKCCQYAKKEPAKKYLEDHAFDLNCVGVRQAEGGARATRYKNCYTAATDGPSQYRPLFWFSDTDKAEYDEHYDLKHSDCYEVWGMRRTGCAGCPFGRNFEEELALAEKYEPKFYKAMLKVFGQSYEYRRQFEAFREEMRRREREVL
jgi:3'-phosphoadenosine 5'-phosphosulfate sulfotransferase (PAPS reductase)/FAD synthetase